MPPYELSGAAVALGLLRPNDVLTLAGAVLLEDLVVLQRLGDHEVLVSVIAEDDLAVTPAPVFRVDTGLGGETIRFTQVK